MDMICHAHSTRDSAMTEYTIYTFRRDQGQDNGPERWQKQETLDAMPAAMKKAEALYESGQYSRVEIKQKFTDPRNSRIRDTTLKTFEKGKNKRRIQATAAIAAIAAGCVGVILILASF